jgi:tetratricopeptide (TPR) repeat protein
MNILTIQTKYADVWALSKTEDFTTWPDALIYDAYVCRGNAASRLRQAADAERDYRAALGATINDYKQAVVYLQLGRLAQGPAALACYDEILKLKAPGGTMRYQAVAGRARLLAAEGKGALALAEFDRVGELTKQPHWSMVQMARAATYETLGETAKARACYEAIISASQPPADLLATAKAKLAALR